ncbi:MAG TPA: secondary thiamine-phosphate synthase enzyme YjbQ [Patescibacteria group bacterium]
MELTITTKQPKQVIAITNLINKQLEKEKTKNGLCFLFIKHTTACLTTADLDPGTDLDMLDAFAALMPQLPYRHPHNPKHVTDHILSSIIGASLVIPIKNGELDLGTWQEVVLIELDGPKERTVTFTSLVL